MPEKQIRSALFKAGFRYRICDKRYPGKPDLIFPRYYAVIIINGCFWHAHEGVNISYFLKQIKNSGKVNLNPTKNVMKKI